MRQPQLPMNATVPIAKGIGAWIGAALLVGMAVPAVAATPLEAPVVDMALASDSLSAPDGPAGDSYAIDRYTIDGGGGASSGGTFEIEGTIGQPDADPLQPSTGGVLELTGGFWPGLAPAAPQPDALFANGFE